MNVFQRKVRSWCVRVFGEAVTMHSGIRAYRFFEEATELVQAGGMSHEEAHKLVDYVYRRPVGEFTQEVGGTYVTLAAYCNAQGVDMLTEAMREFVRCQDPAVIAKIVAKQKTKPNPPAGVA